ncbi:MAG: hypothetical protein BWY96_01840 [Spirochaetes bacterium ADurb.BinA120]|nr:MAG: hypothetical protein BWY96_01840 [Spirochaetes bacterium ADurb.BinA120]
MCVDQKVVERTDRQPLLAAPHLFRDIRKKLPLQPKQAAGKDADCAFVALEELADFRENLGDVGALTPVEPVRYGGSLEFFNILKHRERLPLARIGVHILEQSGNDFTGIRDSIEYTFISATAKKSFGFGLRLHPCFVNFPVFLIEPVGGFEHLFIVRAALPAFQYIAGIERPLFDQRRQRFGRKLFVKRVPDEWERRLVEVLTIVVLGNLCEEPFVPRYELGFEKSAAFEGVLEQGPLAE